MNKKLMLLAAVVLFFAACRKKVTEEDDIVPAPSTLSGNIRQNVTLLSGNTYTLSGLVYVDSGYTMTIQAGTTILGVRGTNSSLIIKRGAKIDAQGTASQPIVFTSSAADGAKNIGDWGGLVILGRARNNGSFNGTLGTMEIEGGINDANGQGLHGGTDDNDNSGILRYVRLEFGGYPFQPDKEINGLTLGSVGRGTAIDHIMVSYCNDDAYEWFGGSVNCSHLISYRNLDDDFDTDNGFSGKIQFGLVIRDTAIADQSAGGASNGFESDNDASGSANSPVTSPVFSNITIIGPKFTPTTTIAAPFRRGAHIRRNSRLSLFNSVIMGWPDAGILIDGTTTVANANAGDLDVQNVLLAGNTTQLKTTVAGFDVNAWFNTPAKNNATAAANTNAALQAPFNYVSFNPNPAVGSPLLSGASFTSAKLSGMVNVSYRGACSGSDNWWTGWTKFFNK